MPAYKVNECTIKNACFGAPDGKPIFCKVHKARHHVDLINKKCVSCDRQSKYCVTGEKTATHCVDHKSYNMSSLYRYTCKSCDKRPSYNLPGESKPIYCKDHKSDEMIDVNHPKL